MKPLVILTGPTAVGKTDLSIKLAKRINGEIISADSMQVYRGMDIGSAKITEEEKCGIKHYLIDVLDPTEDFNVSLFKDMAKKAIDEIYKKGMIPIITGGTGFYIQALLYDVDFNESDGEDTELREMLTKEADEKGADILFERLKKIDPESAKIIHKNNIKRVIRAIEFYEQTGTKISDHNKEQHENESPYNFSYFVLTDDRDKIYDRINKRVDIMLDKGLVKEVETLKNKGLSLKNISMQGLGYKEILAYLDGSITLDEAVEILKRDTRHFAKRQLTWFRREKNVTFIDKSQFKSDEDILLFMTEDMKAKKII